MQRFSSKNAFLTLCLVVCDVLVFTQGNCDAGEYKKYNTYSSSCLSCPGGKYQPSNTFTGSSCTPCTGCNAGTKMTNQCSGTSNNARCVNCPGGKYQPSNNFKGSSCTLCTGCNVGTKMTNQCSGTSNNARCVNCPGEEYQSSNNFKGSSCTPCSKCTIGKSSTTTTTCLKTSDRTCNRCNYGKYQLSNTFTGTSCKNCRSCTTGFRETTQCASTTNRFCSQNICVCENGLAATLTACTLNTKNICVFCSNGYYKNSNRCDRCSSTCGIGKRETTACSSSSDRICQQNICSCLNGNAAFGRSCTTDKSNLCGSCSVGFYKTDSNTCSRCRTCETGTRETAGCFSESNRVCSNNVCFCSNGNTVAGKLCTTHNAEICTSCASTYYLSGNKCLLCNSNCGIGKHKTTACTKSTNLVCQQNICSCSNGNAAFGRSCTTNNAHRCGSCSVGFYKTDSNTCSRCRTCGIGTTETTACFLSSDRTCQTNVCHCSNGVAATNKMIATDDLAWSNSKKTATGKTAGTIHGYFGKDTTSITTTVSGAGNIRIQLRYWAIDSWDGGEKGLIRINGIDKKVLTRQYNNNCDGWSTAFSSSGINDPWRQSMGVDESRSLRCYRDVVIEHQVNGPTFTVTVGTVGSGLNQDLEDESWAFGNLQIAEVSCTSHGSQKCFSCKSGYYLNSLNSYCIACRAACETGTHESAACSSSSNRICTQNTCTCNSGNTAATGADCVVHLANICSSCSINFAKTNDGSCTRCRTSCGMDSSSDLSCTQNTCVCQNGIKATGAACTLVNAHICLNCFGGFYLNGKTCLLCLTCKNGFRETTPCSSSSNRVCAQNICSCSNGIAATGSFCTFHTSNVCVSCSTGYYKDGDLCAKCRQSCGTGFIETMACSQFSNRICSHNVCICINGIAATGTDCRTNGAQICTTCSGGYYKNGNRCTSCRSTCKNGFRETAPCSSSSNRVCTQNVCSCSNGIAATLAACTANTQNICASCLNGFYRNGNSCVICRSACGTGTRETTTCSSSYDRMCQQNICQCSNGIKGKGTECMSHNANICTECDNGFYLAGSSCLAYGGSCLNGELVTQSLRTKFNHCGSCKNGNHLVIDHLDSSRCLVNICKCSTGGTAATGKDCTTHGAEICAGCLTGQSFHSGNCVICTQGTASGGIDEQCLSCRPGYYQELPKGKFFVFLYVYLHIYCSTNKSIFFLNTFLALAYGCKACGAGKYGYAKKQTSESEACNNCNKGRWSNIIGYGVGLASSPCFACGKGKFNIEKGSSAITDCKNCGVGKYNNGVASDTESDCKPCVAGKYNAVTGAQASTYCFECDAETFSVTIASPTIDNCKGCPLGKNQPASGQTNCVINTGCICPTVGGIPATGNACPINGANQCSACPLGSKLSTSNLCETCPQGKYQDQNEYTISSCKYCTSGFYFRSSTTSCNTCATGMYQTSDIFSGTICLNCPEGFQFAAFQIPCIACSPGTYQSENNAANVSCLVWTNCNVGEKGTMPSNIIDRQCSTCVAGKYQPTANQKVSCITCDGGKYATDEGSISCFACPVGRKLSTSPDPLNHDSIEDCTFCEVFFYNPFEGSNRCYMCSNARSKGAISCDGCSPGMFKSNQLGVWVNASCEPSTEMFQKMDDYTIVAASTFIEADTCEKAQVWDQVNEEYRTKCYRCAVGKFSAAHDILQCSNCPTGYYGLSNFPFVTCQKCPRGQYGILEGQATFSTACSKCVGGKYNDQDAMKHERDCKLCEKGKWSEIHGATFEGDCKFCGTGKYGKDVEGAKMKSSCVDCEIGKYLADVGAFGIRSSACTKCPKGFAQNVQGRAFCLPCVPGTISMLSGGIECELCVIGQYRNATQELCQLCPNGFNSYKPGAAVCVECVAGKAGKKCQDCKIGRYRDSDNLDLTQCIDCMIGYYNNATSQPFCLSCDIGMFAEKTKSSTCKACPAGFYQAEKRQHLCLPCEAGTYAGIVEIQGVSKCQDCERGMYTDKTNAIECISCEKGRYTDKKKRKICSDCKIGFYASQFQQSFCDKCPTQSTTNLEGSVNDSSCVCSNDYYAVIKNEMLVCASCPPNSRTLQKGARNNISSCLCQNGYWKPIDGDECLICPIHATCINGLLPKTNDGYWKAPWVLEVLDPTASNSSRPRLPCLEPTACLGASNKTDLFGEEKCAALYQADAPLCAACARGAYKLAASFKCVACFEDARGSVLILLLVILTTLTVIIGFTFATVADGGKAAAVDVIILKIAINSGIITAQASAFPLAWPPSVVTMFQMYAVASASALGDSLSADCVLRASVTRPVQAWGMTMAIIPPALIVLWVVLFTAFRIVSCKQKYLNVHLPVSVIITLTFAHPVITKSAVKLLACRRVAGQYFLDADFNIRCNSEEYMVWASTVAIPLLIIFTFGMPLVYALAMYRHVRNDELEEHRNIYGFFFSGFRKEIWWFELWNTLRKSLFTIVALLFAPAGVMMQTWGALALLLSFLVVFSLSQPYQQDYLNNLEHGALSISVVTLLCGLGLFTNEQSDEDASSKSFAIFLTILIVTSNLLFVISVFYTFSQHTTYCTICKSMEDVLRETEEEEEEEEKEKEKKGQKKQKKNNRSVAVVPAPQIKRDTDAHIYAALKIRQNVFAALDKKLNQKTEGTLSILLRQNSKLKSKKSYRTSTVEKIENQHSQHRNSAVLDIKVRHSENHKNLLAKVDARNKAKYENRIKDDQKKAIEEEKQKLITDARVEKIKELLIQVVQTPTRLIKMFKNFNPETGDSELLERSKFERLINNILAKKNMNVNEMNYLRNETWLSIKKKSKMMKDDLIERQVLNKWLFGVLPVK